MVPLAELCVRITKGTTPTTLGMPFVKHGVNFVKSESIRDDGQIDRSKFAFVDLETHCSLKRSILEVDDVLFSMAGVYLGKTAVVPPDILPANTNQAVGIIRLDRFKACPRFIHYVLSSPMTRAMVKAGVAQSAQPNFNLADIGRLLVPALSLGEQEAVANILGTLDDKIELNRRISDSLEAMARALFKSWFVDFDPVRAKAEGRDPGLPKRLADLFPSRLVDSEIGDIPEGWPIKRFSDVVEHLREQENPLAHSEVLFSHFSIPAYDAGQQPRLELGASIKSFKLRVPTNAVLLSKLNPEIERVWLVDIKPDDQAVCSTEFLVLRAREPFGRSFAYCLARSPVFRQQIEGVVTGTSKSHQRAHSDTILNFAVSLAPPPIARSFESAAANLLERSLTCRRESRTLSAVRSELLPRLISGEIRLRSISRKQARP